MELTKGVKRRIFLPFDHKKKQNILTKLKDFLNGITIQNPLKID